jgi:predicted HTH domain antitoxin
MIATRNIQMQIPLDIFIALNISENELVYNLKLNYAIELYRSGKLTIGKAAELAGVKRYTFESLLAGLKIPVSTLTLQQINNDVDKLNHLLNEES